MPALKVYRTPIGFHDAYVAASSQKAALAVWGAAANLFARGLAELVTDPALTAEPLAQPGVVVKRLRGTVAEQFSALPPDRAREPSPRPKPASKPPPSRAALDAAEATLAEAEARAAAEDADLREREAALARDRAALSKRHRVEAARLAEARDDAKAAYEAALGRWGG